MIHESRGETRPEGSNRNEQSRATCPIPCGRERRLRSARMRSSAGKPAGRSNRSAQKPIARLRLRQADRQVRNSSDNSEAWRSSVTSPGKRIGVEVFEQGGLRPIGARTGAAGAQKLTTGALVRAAAKEIVALFNCEWAKEKQKGQKGKKGAF